MVFSSPAVAGANGDQVIYSNDSAGAVTAYRLSDGTTLWHYLTSMPLYGSDAVADGQVCFAGMDGNVYAFGPLTGSISGTVTDATTQVALSGATVSCTCSSNSTTTDSNGNYSFPGNAPANDYSLTFSAVGYATQTFNNVAVTSGTTTIESAELALGTGGAISGQVTDGTNPSHPPLGGATVTCACEGGSGTTDPNGMYSFTGVPGGTYSMTFSATNFVSQTISGVVVTTGTDTTQNAALTEDGRITGTVTDSRTNLPISGATVACTCRGPSTWTNTSGAYAFTDVTPGAYGVSVSASGYSSASNGDVVVSPGAGTTQDFAMIANSHQVIFSDGFETGTFSAWTASKGLAIERAAVHSGSFAAETTTISGGFAREILASTYTTGYGRVWFNLTNASSQVNVLRLNDASGVPIAYLFVTSAKLLGMTANGTKILSPTKITTSRFHEVELAVALHGTSSTTQVWLDGTPVMSLSRTVTLSASPIAQFQVGQMMSGGSFTIIFDDAAFDTMLLP